MWLFDLSFLFNSANLTCRDTDISKYFRESVGLRDNESRLYMEKNVENSYFGHLLYNPVESKLDDEL